MKKEEKTNVVILIGSLDCVGLRNTFQIIFYFTMIKLYRGLHLWADLLKHLLKLSYFGHNPLPWQVT